MKTKLASLLPVLLVLTLAPAGAAVRYVNLANPSPALPYTTWPSAATNIQSAIDAATAGDEIVVTNGVYATGGRRVDGTIMNRVTVTKPLTLRSVNGPQATTIDGGNAMRCVYLTNGAALVGFMLTNGIAISGAGVWCESTSVVVSNCVLSGNSATYGGGASGGTLNNCTLTGNSVYGGLGGGAAYATLNNCMLTGNHSTASGGGSFGGTLNNCTLTDNSADYQGGGTYGGTINNCTLTGNLATNNGGGTYGGVLNNCSLRGNYGGNGGGVSDGTLYNCTLTGNSARYGGGAAGSTLNNCTLIGNSATYGGGAYFATLYNCIVYYNVALVSGHNFAEGSFNYSCTAPLPPSGVGNISVEPELAGVSRLSANSPCRGAGSATYATGVDIDGEPWANPPSMGCDELHPGAITGPLSVGIVASYTNVAPGFEVSFAAQVNGPASLSRWDFGDGTGLTNRPLAARAWTAPGEHSVVLWAYNESHPEGVSTTLTVHVVEAVYYVAADSSNPVPPYSSWATAARNIQEAVDAAVPGGLVLVTNGVYQTGGQAVFGTMINRVTVTKPLALRSVNGPQATTIDGGNAIRCVYLTNGAALVGFMLTNGLADSGAGVWCESTSVVVSNCVLSGNSATYGGGASGGTLNNCTLTGNSASFYGGGAWDCTLNNCALTGNSATYGGGASGGSGTLSNCTLTDNSADGQGGGAYGGTLNNCSLTGNSARDHGGGAAGSTLNNCTLIGNSATYGGGAWAGTLNNCTITGNSATYGGGAGGGTLNNCTITGNSASGYGGGVAPVGIGCSFYPVILSNCIVYFNRAPIDTNYYSTSLDFHGTLIA